MITSIRKGNLGASYEQLSDAIIDDADNLLVDIQPAKLIDLRHVMEVSGDWTYTPTPSEINAARKLIRQREYERKADPIAFKMLRDEATRDEWDAARADIMTRFPDVEEE